MVMYPCVHGHGHHVWKLHCASLGLGLWWSICASSTGQPTVRATDVLGLLGYVPVRCWTFSHPIRSPLPSGLKRRAARKGLGGAREGVRAYPHMRTSKRSP